MKIEDVKMDMVLQWHYIRFGSKLFLKFYHFSGRTQSPLSQITIIHKLYESYHFHGKPILMRLTDYTEKIGRLSKTMRFFGKCNNPNFHGHNYRLIIVTGNRSTGYVMDVKFLSDIIKV
jgi:hypothetical protein